MHGDRALRIARRQGLQRRRLILAAPAFAATLLAGPGARAQEIQIVAGMVAHGVPKSAIFDGSYV